MPSFRREKFIPFRGPDGGDGGDGGSILFEAHKEIKHPSDFRNKRHFKAENGESGKVLIVLVKKARI